MKITSSTLDDAYFDRNQAVMAFARLAMEKKWKTGIRVDPEEPDWPILYVKTPQGQVSWHLPVSEIDLNEWPVFGEEWDGHSLEDKRQRMAQLLGQTRL